MEKNDLNAKGLHLIVEFAVYYNKQICILFDKYFAFVANNVLASTEKNKYLLYL